MKRRKTRRNARATKSTITAPTPNPIYPIIIPTSPPPTPGARPPLRPGEELLDMSWYENGEEPPEYQPHGLSDDEEDDYGDDHEDDYEEEDYPAFDGEDHDPYPMSLDTASPRPSGICPHTDFPMPPPIPLKPLTSRGESAHLKVCDKLERDNRHKPITHNRYLTQPLPHERADPQYITTYEQWREHFIDPQLGIARASDNNVVHKLLADQPFRVACALTPDGTPPVPTYAPLMFPDSQDPLATAPEVPALPPRPPEWSPRASQKEIIKGVSHEILNCAALYVSRIKTAAGHQPDSEAIAQLKNLASIITDMRRTISPRSPNKTYKTRKRTISKSVKLTEVCVEIAQKNTNNEKRSATPIESTQDVVENVHVKN